MTVKFGPYDSRDRVAGMLEKPVRRLTQEFNSGPAHAEIREIITELDRLDRYAKARAKLAADRAEFNAKTIAAEIKVEDAPDDAVCSVQSYSRYDYHRADHSGKTHRAKKLLNGKPYCLTHLKRVEEQAKWVVLGKRREYVEDAEARAIVDAHEAEVQRRRAIILGTGGRG